MCLEQGTVEKTGTKRVETRRWRKFSKDYERVYGLLNVIRM
jgi:hypothetical protein